MLALVLSEEDAENYLKWTRYLHSTSEKFIPGYASFSIEERESAHQAITFAILGGLPGVPEFATGFEKTIAATYTSKKL